jgi:Arc/MetJ family transcription regulator
MPQAQAFAGPEPAAAVRCVGPCPILTHRASIDEYMSGELIAVVCWIESDTLLRTEDELLAETIRTLGFTRRGSKITAALTAAIAQARRLSQQLSSTLPRETQPAHPRTPPFPPSQARARSRRGNEA